MSLDTRERLNCYAGAIECDSIALSLTLTLSPFIALSPSRSLCIYALNARVKRDLGWF